MNVAISGPVDTYFARLLGITSFPAARSAKAEFVLPVPMGSPENYYGVFGTIRGATYTSPQSARRTCRRPGGRPRPGHRATGAAPRRRTPTTTARTPSARRERLVQQWGNYGISLTPTVTAIDGIEVRLRTLTPATGTPTTSCQLDASLSWDGGSSWTAVKSVVLTSSKTLYTLGSTSDAWGHPWTVSQQSNANFRLRLAF